MSPRIEQPPPTSIFDRQLCLLTAALLVAGTGCVSPRPHLCEPPPLPSRCPPQENWTPQCYNPDQPCDCPVPPEEDCVAEFPHTLGTSAEWVQAVGGLPEWAGAWIWSEEPGPETRYLVTLPGSDELAAKELYWWYDRIRRLRRCLDEELGVIAVQYLRLEPGTDAEAEYLSAEQIHQLIDSLLRERHAAALAARSGHVFHGFSRGSANLYAVAVLDGHDGSRWGRRFIANSGAWRPGEPPPAAVAEELKAGSRTALAGTEFLIYYGHQDHDPEQNGAIGQSEAARVVRTLGGDVRMLVHPDGCHSAFESSAQPELAFDAVLWAFGGDAGPMRQLR